VKKRTIHSQHRRPLPLRLMSEGRNPAAEATLLYQDETRRLEFLSQKRVARLGTGACLLSLVILLCFPTWAQLGQPASAPAAAQPEAPKDALGRTTPRGTVLGFLSAARNGDDDLAARYLDTRLRGRTAAGLAHKLFVVLDRRLPAQLNELSDKPEGSLSNPLKPDEEPVGTIGSDNGDVDIIVQRVGSGKSASLWLFSSKTLDVIPDLYEEINLVSVDNVLPAFLVNTRIAGILLFHWLAIFVGIPLFFLLAALINRLLSHFVGLLRRRLYRKANLPNPEVLPKPIRLLLLAFVIRWLLTKISLPLLARQFWSSAATIITVAGCVWLVIFLARWGEEYICRLLQRRKLTGAASMLRLTRWVIDLLAIVAGVLVTLHYFGVNPTAALAGLGVGGIAVALAAQKTLENIIAGVSLIFDQAVRVGDSLKIGNTQGTIEDIGLRSTRIRTLDRTMVSVPNGQIANMSIENLSSRDKFWFHPILSLNYGTASSQIHAALDRIRSLLEESPHVESDSVRVRFLRFGPPSIEVEVFAYVLASDWNQFLEIQEGLLLRIMECVESIAAQIAIPPQNTLSTAFTSNDAERRALLKAPAPDKKASDQTVAKSA
jgi:MscS family membrane protein